LKNFKFYANNSKLLWQTGFHLPAQNREETELGRGVLWCAPCQKGMANEKAKYYYDG
jgi:hypothetical protein